MHINLTHFFLPFLSFPFVIESRFPLPFFTPLLPLTRRLIITFMSGSPGLSLLIISLLTLLAQLRGIYTSPREVGQGRGGREGGKEGEGMGKERDLGGEGRKEDEKELGRGRNMEWIDGRKEGRSKKNSGGGEWRKEGKRGGGGENEDSKEGRTM